MGVSFSEMLMTALQREVLAISGAAAPYELDEQYRGPEGPLFYSESEQFWNQYFDLIPQEVCSVFIDNDSQLGFQRDACDPDHPVYRWFLAYDDGHVSEIIVNDREVLYREAELTRDGWHETSSETLEGTIKKIHDMLAGKEFQERIAGIRKSRSAGIARLNLLDAEDDKGFVQLGGSSVYKGDKFAVLRESPEWEMYRRGFERQAKLGFPLLHGVIDLQSVSI